MKVYVCLKQVPDTETKIKLKPDASGIDLSGVKWVMNPYDEFAVEEALKLKEAGKASSVTALSLGPKSRVVDALRTALAMGADDAIVIDGPEHLDSLATAKALASAIKAEGEFLCVLTGKLAIDDNASAVSQMMAEFLSVPHATVISKLDLQDKSATVEREVEGGAREVIQFSLPGVVAANKGLNLPRYASLPGIMKAKKKPIKEVSWESLGVSETNLRIEFCDFQMPPEKGHVKMLNGDASEQTKALARELRDVAKVI